MKICADTFAPRPPPPYCAHGLRASAACVLYVKLTDGKGQLAPGWGGGLLYVRRTHVPASGAPYVPPRTVAPQAKKKAKKEKKRKVVADDDEDEGLAL